MLKSLDNSNGIQYYGGNDPAKMGGRFKKGGGGGSATASSAKRSAVGQRTSVADRFGTRAKAVERFQGVLRDRNSTPEERDAAKRIITSNAALGGLSGEAARRAFLTRAGFG